jgi:tetratricopeptide (TPR) repeat protein
MMTLASNASAEGSAADRAAAEVLFDRALELMKVGDYAGACPQLEESQKLDPAVGTLLYLGDCYEQQGRVASAWASFNAAAAAARSARQPERERIAQQRSDALAPRLPKLIVAVDDNARLRGLEVRRDGALVGEGSWGVPIPLDPGQHEVRATAPGRAAWSRRLSVQPTGVTRTVRVPKLEPATQEPATLGAPAAAAADDEGISTPDALRIAGGFVGGAGLLGLGFGIAYGVRSQSMEDDSEAFCQPPDYVICTQEGLDLLDESATASTIANGSFIVGGLLAATGLVLIIAAPAAEDSDAETPDADADALDAVTRWTIAPVVGSDLRGMTISTNW